MQASPKFRELLLAFESYLDYKQARDKAKNDCSRSWGYFGYEYERDLEKAEAELEVAFNEYLIVAPFRCFNTPDRQGTETSGLMGNGV